MARIYFSLKEVAILTFSSKFIPFYVLYYFVLENSEIRITIVKTKRRNKDSHI